MQTPISQLLVPEYSPLNEPCSFVSFMADSMQLHVKKKGLVYSRGEDADAVFFIRNGRVRLITTSSKGKEATIALLGPGDFLGEEAIRRHRPVRMATAISLTNSYLVRIDRRSMLRRLSQEHAFAACFLDYLLARNARLQDDLVDHIFNSAEKRLARLLLLLAHPEYRHHDMPLLPKISQETLATIIGSTRQRVNMLMNRFKRMGVIANGHGLRINPTMLQAFLLE